MRYHLCLVLGLSCAAAPLVAQAPAVPYTMITISGGQSTGTGGTPVTYRAYQAPGETYRVVCQEPCGIAESLIFAVYQGFKPAKQQLVQLAGIDSLPALQPFDIHLNADSWCGPYSAFAAAGDAGVYWVGVQAHGTFGCFWNVEKALPQPPPYLPTPFTAEDELKIERQLLRVHEYGHTLFFNRHFYSYEDMVKAFSFYISGINGTFITDPCDPYLASFGMGRLIHELCAVAGFRWSDLAPALQEIDREYRQGLGEVSSWSPPLTSVSQLRRALDARLGRATRDAFLSAGMLPHQAGDERPWGPAAGSLDLGAGALRLRFPAQSLSGATTFSLNQIYMAPSGQPLFDFDFAFVLGPANVFFGISAPMTFRYDPTLIAPTSAEGSMKLFRVVSGSWQEVPGSFLDATDGTVSVPVSGTGTYALVPTAAADPTVPSVVVPTVASTAGAFGSFFKTALRLHNPRDTAIAGKLVFHPAGAGSPNDPSLAYSLAYHETKVIPDFLPAVHATGSGSIDLLATTGPVPLVDTRVFNDGGDAGTTGVTETPVKPAAALRAGDRGVLLVPPSLSSQRLNVGVRTLGGGAVLTVTVKNAAGAVVKQLSKSYGATFYEQKSLSDFLDGTALAGNESLGILVTSGAAIVYGGSADNISNDPSLQVSRPIPPASGLGDPLYLPTVVSAPGRFDSFYKTAVQLHNPEATTVSGKIVFHPAGASGTAQDPSLAYALAPGQTRFVDDLLPAMGQSGSGSADVVPSSGPAPFLVVRAFNDAGSAGTTGLTEDALTSFAALLPGDHGVLLAPADMANERMNVGVRTLGAGALVTVTVRGTNGYAKGSPIQKTYPANYYEQTSLAEFVSPVQPGANDSIDVRVSAGGLFVYGATADNRTNDPSLQVPRRQANF